MSSDQPETEEAEQRWPVIVTLKHPIDFGSQRIASLEFRRGKMGDLSIKGLTPGELPSFDQLFMIASRMCGQPTKLLEMLADEDGSEVLAIAMNFFVRSLPDGKKLSHR